MTDYFKQNLQVSVIMKPTVPESDALMFRKELDSMVFVHGTEFISKEQGEKEMEDMLGKDFLKVFETSPVPTSISVTLDPRYVLEDSLKVVEAAIGKSPLVDEVVYQRSLVDALNANISKISLVLGVFIFLMLFISFVLINNTMRLTVYAKRFTVHTMKLVGATKAFIRGAIPCQGGFLGLVFICCSIDPSRGCALRRQVGVCPAFRNFHIGETSHCDGNRDCCRSRHLCGQHVFRGK